MTRARLTHPQVDSIVNSIFKILQKAHLIDDDGDLVFSDLVHACIVISTHEPDSLISDTPESLLRLYQLTENEEPAPNFASEEFHRIVMEYLVPQGHLNTAISILESVGSDDLLRKAAYINNIAVYVDLVNQIRLIEDNYLGICFKFATLTLQNREKLAEFCRVLTDEMNHFGCYWMDIRLFAFIVEHAKTNHHAYLLRAFNYIDAAGILTGMKMSFIGEVLPKLAASNVSFLTLYRHELVTRENLIRASTNPYCTRALEVCENLYLLSARQMGNNQEDIALREALMKDKALCQAIALVGEAITAKYKRADGLTFVPPRNVRECLDDVVANCEIGADGYLYVAIANTVVRVAIKANPLTYAA